MFATTVVFRQQRPFTASRCTAEPRCRIPSAQPDVVIRSECSPQTCPPRIAKMSSGRRIGRHPEAVQIAHAVVRPAGRDHRASYWIIPAVSSCRNTPSPPPERRCRARRPSPSRSRRSMDPGCSISTARRSAMREVVRKQQLSRAEPRVPNASLRPAEVARSREQDAYDQVASDFIPDAILLSRTESSPR